MVDQYNVTTVHMFRQLIYNDVLYVMICIAMFTNPSTKTGNNSLELGYIINYT